MRRASQRAEAPRRRAMAHRALRRSTPQATHPAAHPPRRAHRATTGRDTAGSADARRNTQIRNQERCARPWGAVRIAPPATQGRGRRLCRRGSASPRPARNRTLGSQGHLHSFVALVEPSAVRAPVPRRRDPPVTECSSTGAQPSPGRTFQPPASASAAPQRNRHAPDGNRIARDPADPCRPASTNPRRP